jgi:hypothetical protein
MRKKLGSQKTEAKCHRNRSKYEVKNISYKEKRGAEDANYE